MTLFKLGGVKIISNKIMTMEEAIKKSVHNNDLVFLGGFSNGIPFSAAHEIIRENIRNLKICKCSGGMLFDQLIGAGVTDQIITSHCWNPHGPQPAWNLKRAMEEGIPQKIRGCICAGGSRQVRQVIFFIKNCVFGSNIGDFLRKIKKGCLVIVNRLYFGD